MINELEVLKIVVKRLESAGVPYMIKDTLSEMQIRDVMNLMKTVPDLDIKYIENWIKELELEAIYRKVAP